MSGNPVPQHSPTDGLGVAAEVIVTSDGQGGSALTTIVAAREYKMTLSLSAVSGWNAAVRLTAAAKDVAGGLYFPQQNYFVNRNENAAVATAVASGTNNNTILVTAVALGETVLDIAFPTFDNTESGSHPEMVYCQVKVTVIP